MNGSTTAVIAIDAMGGDIGLDTTIAAAVRAQNQHSNLRLILVGDEPAIRAHQLFANLDSQRFSICHAEQVVTMEDKPSSVLRHKRQSSLWKALELVRDNRAQACVSAGNTGALMACAWACIKTMSGISRPAICATVPSQYGHVHWLDLGANVDSDAEQLLQFALMGSELAKAVDGNGNPQVGLLNIGEEEIKGNAVVKKAAKLLEESPVNYAGFVEGNDIFLKQHIDVVVCDGFVGNVALKSTEGVAKFIQNGLKEAFNHNIYGRLMGLLALPVLKRFKSRMDPRNYNGATLLGLKGIVVKSHGNADKVSFANAINIARLEIAHNVIPAIQAQLEKYQPQEEQQ